LQFPQATTNSRSSCKFDPTHMIDCERHLSLISDRSVFVVKKLADN
jgi:hypothetical protein